MEYSIKLNAVNNPEKSVRAFATVTFGDCFKITNIAVVEGRESQPFVSMPSFKSKERTEHNEPVYKDVCNPITSEFRKALYDDILSYCITALQVCVLAILYCKGWWDYFYAGYISFVLVAVFMIMGKIAIKHYA